MELDKTVTYVSVCKLNITPLGRSLAAAVFDVTPKTDTWRMTWAMLRGTKTDLKILVKELKNTDWWNTELERSQVKLLTKPEAMDIMTKAGCVAGPKSEDQFNEFFKRRHNE